MVQETCQWRGRLAPSPTGRLHIGNAYAALAAWLSARSRGGQIVLRIEDIDRDRCPRDADLQVIDDYQWLGLDWDGEPLWQSRRFPLYERILNRLRERGLLYPCFCSRADLHAASAPHDDDGFYTYPGTCRSLGTEEKERRLAQGRRHSWRIALPDRDVTVDDRIYGPRTYNLARDCGDIVLRRSDGMPAYQLAATVDDMAQDVTDIVRGRDLLRSAAIQLWLRECLAEDCADILGGPDTASAALAPPSSPSLSARPTPLAPSFAHLPLIDDPQGRRLAKRDKAVDLGELRAAGVVPERVVGYCAWLLGICEEPRPARPTDLVDSYSEAAVRRDLSDRVADAACLCA